MAKIIFGNHSSALVPRVRLVILSGYGCGTDALIFRARYGASTT